MIGDRWSAEQPEQAVDLGRWFWRVISWDTLLPAVILLIPSVVEQIFPKNRGAMEILAVIVPMIAFFMRVHFGRKQISANHCSMAIRRFQFVVFFIGIVPLVLIDCVFILSHLMPQGALFAARTDLVVWGVLIAIYLAAMIIAMYPGRAETSAHDEAMS